MNDPPGVQYPLGVEAVEWSSAGSQQLVVHVTGRWRRRRIGTTVRPILVIESDAARHRFPALPEPPGVGSAPPGMWRMTFSVPAVLAPALGGRLSLLFGGAAIPLPAAVHAEPLAEAAGEQAAALAIAAESPALSVVPDAPLPPEPGLASVPEPRVDEFTIADRRVRAAELAADRARHRTAEAEKEADELASVLLELEQQLEAARAEPEGLRAQLAEQQRALRQAEQRLHSERALRNELEAELDELEAELEAERARNRGQARELDELRRQADEADHALAAARAAQLRAERRLRELAEPERPRDLRGELRLARATPPAPAAVDPEPGASSGTAHLLAFERAMAAARAAPPRQTSPPPADPSPPPEPGADSEPRADSEPSLDPDFERRLAAQRATALRTWQAVEDLRHRLDTLLALHADRAPEAATPPAPEPVTTPPEAELVTTPPAPEPVTTPPAPEPAAESPPAQATEPEPLAEPVTPQPPELQPLDPVGTVEPERLSAALSRLRDTTPPVPEPEAHAEPAPEHQAQPGPEHAPKEPQTGIAWIRRVLRRLAAVDPALAGRLIEQLLPAQHLVHPAPLAYDLYLSDVGSVRVSVAGATTTVAVDNAQRPRQELDFTVVGDLAGLARLLTRGPIRRRLTRHVARVDGRRRTWAPLRALVASELDLTALHGAGVGLDARLALTVVSLMIQPRWTDGERFTIGVDTGSEHPGLPGAAYLHVRDGEAPTVTALPPMGSVVTTVVCPPEQLLAVLAGDRDAAASVQGDKRPLMALERWIDRAQHPRAHR